MRISPVGWIVTNWRLKALSLLLAVGLLGGVAFSENPPIFGSVPVKVTYDLPPNLVVINPTTTVDVPVAGFRNDVQRYQETSAGVTIDLQKARPGRDQVYYAQPRQDLAGLTFRESAIPIKLDIETMVTRQFDIEVRAEKRSAGIAVVPDRTYATCGNANDHCQVSVTGPTSVLAGLRAFVNYDVPITTASTATSPNQPIKFEENGTPIDLNRSPATVPQIMWTPDNVTVLVTTQGGIQTKTVPVSPHLMGTQACGYQIAGVDVQPSQVTVSGPAEAVSRITSVSMDPISLTGLSSSQRYVRPVVTGLGVTADPPQVSVGVTLIPAFNCAAPSPAASVLTPAASPLPTPTVIPSAITTPTPTPTP
jgi:YbbR domain-containing protein